MMTDERGTKLCNFTPHVEKLVCALDVGSGKENCFIQIRIDFEEEHSSVTFNVPHEEIGQIRWRDRDCRCRFNPEVSTRKIERYLEDEVRMALSCAPREKKYRLDHPGIFVVKDEVVFCTGWEVIKPPGSVLSEAEIELQPMGQYLEIDVRLSEAQAVSEMFEFLSLSPNPGRIILAHKLIYLMRRAYADAGVEPKLCVYLHGKSGTNKTTLSSFLSQTYNRKNGVMNPQRLNASIPAAVQMLSETLEDIVVLDDLFPADSKTIRRQQEESLIEVTRYIADGVVPARMKGKKVLKGAPRCGVVFTGEYVIGSGSDAARLLMVEMMQPDGERLKYFQDRPLIISTFYFFYIKWFIARYKEIVPLLKAWLCQYRKVNPDIHSRLWETHFFFNTAYALLMQYCYEKNFLQYKDAIRLQSSFHELLTTLVWKQNERVQKKMHRGMEHKDYWECIRALYKNGQLSVANSVEYFDKEINDGVIHKNSLYLRGDKLSVYFPGADISDIAEELIKQGVLDVGKNNRTKQISALGGMRFYVIPLEYIS